jgi:hypothetical protein
MIMGLSIRKTVEKIEVVIQAWSKLRPGKTFAGHTLEQFIGLIQPSRDVRVEISEAELRLQSANARRVTVDRVSMKALQRVINAVKADPEEGDDGELYAAMGFVRSSERSTGLTRRRKGPGTLLAGQMAEPAPKAVSA